MADWNDTRAMIGRFWLVSEMIDFCFAAAVLASDLSMDYRSSSSSAPSSKEGFMDM
ncbi:hypothetical protein JAAARDRAFT_34402 [Jaapia argillacea MUCL 33604]|uniref:Uncharacterized protein n=1 Tax=Jaapia argillacea MUCL 33604 TaxID=933084 RepID=A0A067PUT1_9AGAM|nr:hypothetical protein JAAARDRAFT_34402 [Jaapia argillacea MUCL 33604]